VPALKYSRTPGLIFYGRRNESEACSRPSETPIRSRVPALHSLRTLKLDLDLEYIRQRQAAHEHEQKNSDLRKRVPLDPKRVLCCGCLEVTRLAASLFVHPHASSESVWAGAILIGGASAQLRLQAPLVTKATAIIKFARLICSDRHQLEMSGPELTDVSNKPVALMVRATSRCR